MNKDYHAYLELFEYFGRGGLRKLSQAEFIEADTEFEQLWPSAASPKRAPLSVRQARRLLELRDLLLRDRPTREKIAAAVEQEP